MISKELVNLGETLLIVWLVWRSYRNSIFAPAKKYATFWPRFWTGTVDHCVLWPLRFVVSLVLLWPLPAVLGVALSLASNVIRLTYTVWMHARNGQTVGKMVCKVRVVDNLSEGPISVRQALLRECVPVVASLGMVGYFLYLVGTGALVGERRLHPENVVNWRVLGPLLAAPLIWFLVEVVTRFSNDKRRALHDLIAGTTVVRTHLAAA